MIQFLKILSALIDAEGQVHLFCSVLQLKRCYELLVGAFKDIVMEDNAVEGDKVCGQATAFCEVETEFLHYLRAPEIYHSHPRVKHFQHMSVAEFVVHFWWRAIPAYENEMLLCLDYTPARHVSSADPGLTNVVSNVPLISFE